MSNSSLTLRSLVACCALFLSAGSSSQYAAAAEAGMRTWTDDTGKHTIEAEFVEIKQGRVSLKKPDGLVVSLPLSRLSKEDQAYLRELMKSKRSESLPDEGGTAVPFPVGTKVEAYRMGKWQPGEVVEGDARSSRVKVKLEGETDDNARSYPLSWVRAEGAGTAEVPAATIPGRTRRSNSSEVLPPWNPPDMKPAVEPEFSAVSAIARSGASDGKLAPDPGPTLDAWEPLSVSLSKKRTFFERLNDARLESVEAPQVIAVHSGGSGVGDPRTRIERITLENSVTQNIESAPAKIEKFSASPSGKRLLTISAKDDYWAPTRLDFWQFGNKQLEHEVSFHPYAHTEKKGAVEWFHWIDDDHLLTGNRDKQVIAWDVPAAKALYEKKFEWSSEPVMSPGAAYYAVATKGGVEVYDSLSGRQLAQFSGENAWNARLAFSPSGKYLAVVSGSYIDIIDVATGEPAGNIYHRPFAGHAPGWLDDDHLLLGEGDVVDRERRFTVWRFENIGNQFGSNPQHRWFFDSHSDPRQVACLTLPVEQMRESAAALSKLSDDELLALRPGSKVSLDVSLVNRDLEASTKAQLTKSLAEAGMQVADGQPIRLIARMENGQPASTTYRSFGIDRTETQVSYTPLVYRTTLEIDGAKVWEKESIQSPGAFLPSKEGETVDQAVNRVMDPNASYFGGRFPTHLVKPQYQEPPGTTKLSFDN